MTNDQITVKIKVHKLIGKPLDWAVAQFRGRANDKNWMNHSVYGNYSPSTRRELGGEIIDDAGISTTIGHDGQWVAYNAYNLNDEKRFMHCDKSRLVAAMRTFVESNAGPEIEVPQSVTQ